MKRKTINCCGWLIALLLFATTTAAQAQSPALNGKVITREKEEIPYATVRLKGTSYGCSTNEKGFYYLYAPAGEYSGGVGYWL